jgi:hypothetical protein
MQEEALTALMVAATTARTTSNASFTAPVGLRHSGFIEPVSNVLCADNGRSPLPEKLALFQSRFARCSLSTPGERIQPIAETPNEE